MTQVEKGAAKRKLYKKSVELLKINEMQENDSSWGTPTVEKGGR